MLQDLWAGKKTHMLVLGAVVINALATIVEGGPAAVMDADTALETIKLGMVSTFKMGVDRALTR